MGHVWNTKSWIDGQEKAVGVPTVPNKIEVGEEDWKLIPIPNENMGALFNWLLVHVYKIRCGL